MAGLLAVGAAVVSMTMCMIVCMATTVVTTGMLVSVRLPVRLPVRVVVVRGVGHGAVTLPSGVHHGQAAHGILSLGHVGAHNALVGAKEVARSVP